MKYVRHYTLLTIMLCLGLLSNSQGVKPVVMNKYTQKSGLSSYFVTKIIRDHYGFTWVATQEGLNRFDGLEFQVFSTYSEPRQRLSAAFIYDIVEDQKRNLLWVLPTYGEICAIDLATLNIRTRIRNDATGTSLRQNWWQSLCLTGDTLWIGGDAGLMAYQIEKEQYLPFNWKKISGYSTEKPPNVSELRADSLGRLWTFNDGLGILVLNRNWQVEKKFQAELGIGPANAALAKFWDIALRDSTLYAATSLGLLRLSAGKNLQVLPNLLLPALQTTEVFSVNATDPQNLFLSAAGHIYALSLNTGQLSSYIDAGSQDDWHSLTRQLYYDSAIHQLWIGTQVGLANFSLNDPALQSFAAHSFTGKTASHSYSLLPAGNNLIYCADASGFYSLNLKNRQSQQIDSTPLALMVCRGWANEIFVSNEKGLFLLQQNKLQPVGRFFPELDSIGKSKLNCGLVINDSLMAFSDVYRKGLTIWNRNTHSIRQYHENSQQHRVEKLSTISWLYKTKENHLLLVTDQSILTFNPISEQYQRHDITTENHTDTLKNFMDICETDSSYWIASYGSGLIETDKGFRTKRVISKNEGIENPFIYRVFPYKNRQIIASTNYGLSVVNTANYSVNNYFQSDGLHGDNFEQLCGYQSGDSVYAGGLNGFSIIRTDALSNNLNATTPLLRNYHLETTSGKFDSTHFNLRSITIPNNAQRTTLYFSALNYSNPERVSFQYRIKNKEDNWINFVGKNFIDLIGLSPGTYQLEVRAVNEAGIWTTQPLKLQLIFLPKWYQTWWFKALVALAFLALVYAVYRYRITQIRKQQQIRRSIASDLHDDIGSTLNSVKIFAHLARREPGNPDHFNQMEASLAEASLGLRDILWVLDDSVDTLFELMERIKKFAQPICQAEQIQFTASLDPGLHHKAISKSEKRNLLLIAKESINNCIKYAGCSQIKVQLRPWANQFIFEIEDNGCGFNPNQASQGNGLKNIRFRAEQIRFACQIHAAPGEGTRIELVKQNKRS